ncbi:kinetochore-associated protein DSN1 homolog [Betta splendens]|uniref:Kinetochore-associated protein DSN1 homolog n=1 Tax=Betta splendens TaxID=158456 RepID=A0A6P7ND88_BETSP|nr:kinetochore-associated protein DSN1 homolog [Betta splendens]
MAEKDLVDGEDSSRSVAVVDNEMTSQTLKRCASSSPSTHPKHKSPRTSCTSPTIQATHAGDEHSKTHEQEMQTKKSEEPSRSSGSPTKRRKSGRRATISTRSLPALPNPYLLCRSIRTSLTQDERLEKLMEASMMLAIERTQNSLQSVPNFSLESFQKQVKDMQKDWGRLAKSIHSESKEQQLTVDTASNPSVQRPMENVQKAINRLQAENESWEALLSKQRKKEEELQRKVEQGQETGVPLDSSSMARSSQYTLIKSKPDYLTLLSRQQTVLQTVIMETQSKMVKVLMSIKKQSQLVVKEISARLVAEAGFQELMNSKNFLAAPLSSAAT